MEIARDSYLQQLISYQWDGLVKVITGIRRCGKSYLLKTIYKRYLLEHEVEEDQIIIIELDLVKDIRYRNPLELASYVRSLAEGRDKAFYLFIDEIQMSDSVANPYHREGKRITFYPFSARRLRPLRSGRNCVRITLDKGKENTIIKLVEK